MNVRSKSHYRPFNIYGSVKTTSVDLRVELWKISGDQEGQRDTSSNKEHIQCFDTLVWRD